MIEHRHLTPELLDAHERGDISGAQLFRLVAEGRTCEDCQAILDEWQRPTRSRIGYRSLLSQVLNLAIPPTSREGCEAQRDFEALLELPHDERKPKIRRAFKRFRSPRLAELLLEASSERRLVDANEAYHLAGLAQTVVHQCPASARAHDLRVLCVAHLAAASKVKEDFDAAEHQFRVARRLLDSLPAPHPVVQAELALLEGSYRKDRRQLERSQRLLHEAASLSELLDDRLLSVRSRLVLGGTDFLGGRVGDAITTAQLALDDINPKEQPRLFVMGKHNISLYLCEVGAPLDAARRFKANLPLYKQIREAWPNLDFHFHWLAGKIQRGLGRFPQAKDHLIRARDGFAEHGTRYDANLVSRDLALVYAAQRQP